MGRKSDRGLPYVKQWASIYLKAAQARFQQQLKGYDLSIEDVYVFQQLCAYEVRARIFSFLRRVWTMCLHTIKTVALGYSKFCELFTEEEWDGFSYA
jgi:hypothetical protein